MSHARAPDFVLPDENGKSRSLSEFLAKGPVVFVFYPGDFTPVCTRQLCSYRDASEDLNALGVQVVGISADPPEKHQEFKRKFGFSFPLLSDPEKKVAKAFGATSKWLFGGVTRANFIVNTKGEIVYSHVDALPVTHQKATGLKEALQQLRVDNRI